MQYLEGYGVFFARQRLTPRRAAALAGAGLRRVLIQVDWQRSSLPQRSVETLRAETAAAGAAGLETWWWAWCEPAGRGGEGRRPTGPEALGRRLDLLVAELGSPAGFVADCEVGGGWRPRALGELAAVEAAARAAGMPVVGLTSHGLLAPAWFRGCSWDVGLPQCFSSRPLEVETLRRWLGSWSAVPSLWPALGCSDSSAEQMRADLAALAEVGGRGAAWWSSRGLGPGTTRLAAAVPEASKPLRLRALSARAPDGDPEHAGAMATPTDPRKAGLHPDNQNSGKTRTGAEPETPEEKRRREQRERTPDDGRQPPSNDRDRPMGDRGVASE